MDSSTKTGLMAVCAVSGSVVFVALQIHKRLLSRFMERMELEIRNPTGTEMEIKEEPKKRVRFADNVAESSVYHKGGGRAAAAVASAKSNDENLEALPENWQAMYKEILHQRHNLRSCN